MGGVRLLNVNLGKEKKKGWVFFIPFPKEFLDKRLNFLFFFFFPMNFFGWGWRGFFQIWV